MLMHILVAEDYKDNRELLRLLLEMNGYAVTEACDGGECVRLVQERVPDLALIDIEMPVMSGFEVIRAVRGETRTSRLPCIALTAHASEQDRARMLAAGFDAFIGKPFTTENLLQTIKDLLPKIESAAPLD
jgi:CheY-like chemotaxis protein